VLAFYKGFKSEIPDALQVSHQAGIVFGPVPFIQLQHALAGIFAAFVTEFGFRFSQVAAVKYDTIYPAGQFGCTFQAATHALVLFAQIAKACSAIHAARGHKKRINIRQRGVN
jgi:hypothetical protein